jgi:hypothetical protein
VFVETESVPMRNSVVIPGVTTAFDEQGKPVSPMTNAAAADVMLDDLAWWSAALEQARAAGELPDQGIFHCWLALPSQV